MTDPGTGLLPTPATLPSTFTPTPAGGVGYMMMSYSGRPPMVPTNMPMQPAVGMSFMPLTAPPIMPTIVPMSQMITPTPSIVTQPFLNQQQLNRKSSSTNGSEKLALLEIPKGPPITVFVGNLNEKAPDVMVRHLLSACGHVASWKRVQGFGFCEFGNPDAALRAIRILHDLDIGGKKLVLKVDAKTKTTLDEFKSSRRKHVAEAQPQKPEEETKPEKNDVGDSQNEEDDEYMDDDIRSMDENSRKRMQEVLEEFKDEIAKHAALQSNEDEKSKTESDAPESRMQSMQQRLLKFSRGSETNAELLNMKIDLDTVDYAEDGKRDLISREIGKFREIMKDNYRNASVQTVKRLNCDA